MGLLRVGVVRPEQRALGVDDDLVGRGVAVLGEGLVPDGRGGLGRVTAGEGELELGRYAALRVVGASSASSVA